MTSVAPLLTLLISKLPSKSVIVPVVVPFTRMDAPMTASPCESITTPLQVLLCCVISTPATLSVAAFTAKGLKAIMASKMLTDVSLLDITVIFWCL